MRLTRFARPSPSRPRRPRTIFAAARAHGLPVKLHARATVQSRRGAGRGALRRAVGRPPGISRCRWDRGDRRVGHRRDAPAGAFYYLNETRKPPVEALRAAKVPIAVASDLNPGSSPVHSLLTTMNMASVLFGLTRKVAPAVSRGSRHWRSAYTIAAGLPGASGRIWQSGTPAHLSTSSIRSGSIGSRRRCLPATACAGSFDERPAAREGPRYLKVKEHIMARIASVSSGRAAGCRRRTSWCRASA